MHEHRRSLVRGLTSRYRLTYLVYFEQTTEVESAIAREKEIKAWRRQKKLDLIATLNTEWNDLSIELLGVTDSSRRSE
jgi:putative endonuclease